MAWTNIGKTKMFEAVFNSSSLPAYFCLQLATSDSGTWNADLSSTSQVTLVSEGGGYVASGERLDRDTAFFTVTQNDDSDFGQAALAQSIDWSATPAGSGINDIHYVMLTDDNADANDKTIWAWWSLGADVDIPAEARFIVNSASLKAT